MNEVQLHSERICSKFAAAKTTILSRKVVLAHACAHIHARTHAHHDGALLAMGLVKLQHLLEGVVTDHITVQNKERLLITVQDLPSQGQWTSYRNIALIIQLFTQGLGSVLT